MSTEPHTPHEEQNLDNTTTETPTWYPATYPEWIVTEACAAVLVPMLTGASLNKQNETFSAAALEGIFFWPFASASQKSRLIRCMALATNPEMSEREIRFFLKGITDAYIANHASALPKRKTVYEAYPEFKKMADDDDPERDLETAKEFLDVMIKQKTDPGEGPSQPVA